MRIGKVALTGILMLLLTGCVGNSWDEAPLDRGIDVENLRNEDGIIHGIDDKNDIQGDDATFYGMNDA